MGLFGIIKRGKVPKPKRKMSPHEALQTNRCNVCGGNLFPNRIKQSQMICANCGNRITLY